MSEGTETLGQRLRAERERKGLSAQKAADQLHLDAWVIDALESGDYARIGPAVYGKGHLKRYAGLLGLPAAEILEAYDTRSPAPTAQPSTLLMRSSDTGDRALPWLLIAGVAVTMLIVAVVLWRRPWQPHAAANAASSIAGSSIAGGGTRSSGVNRESAAVDHRDEDGGTPTQGGGAGGATAGDVTGPGAQAGALADSSSPAAVAASEGDSTAGAGRARLRLSFSADSWVDVRDAMGRRLFAGYGRANSVKTIAGPAPLKVYLGFASGVQLEVNNHVVAIGPQFVAGDAAHFEAGADGVLRVGARVSAANPHPRG
jgi:cytoskeleton protein RodZ